MLEEGQYPVVEQVGRRDGHLGRVDLGEAHEGVGVHDGLLIDAAYALEVDHIERVLAQQIAGVGSLDLVGVGLPLALGCQQAAKIDPFPALKNDPHLFMTVRFRVPG